jgi:hypothetical protein
LPKNRYVVAKATGARTAEAARAPNIGSWLSRARQGYGSGVGYALLADLVMFLHFTFLACVVFGGFLALKWPRVIWAHVLLVAWGFSTIVFSIRCPLTDVEHWARARAGEARLTGTGFIDHYIEGVLYPEDYTRLLQAAAAVIVAGSWVGFVMRRRFQHLPARPPL